VAGRAAKATRFRRPRDRTPPIRRPTSTKALHNSRDLKTSAILKAGARSRGRLFTNCGNLVSTATRRYITVVGGFPGEGSPPPSPPADVFLRRHPPLPHFLVAKIVGGADNPVALAFTATGVSDHPNRVRGGGVWSLAVTDDSPLNVPPVGSRALITFVTVTPVSLKEPAP